MSLFMPVIPSPIDVYGFMDVPLLAAASIGVVKQLACPWRYSPSVWGALAFCCRLIGGAAIERLIVLVTRGRMASVC